jgi:hypothetical protein
LGQVPGEVRPESRHEESRALDLLYG